LRRFRPRSYRYQQEQAAIEAWLALIVAAAARSAPLALEIAACARLLKGYGDTLKRGAANYAAIERQVIRPILTGTIPLSRGIDAVASATAAALAHPEAERLAKCLAESGQMHDVPFPPPRGGGGWGALALSVVRPPLPRRLADARRRPLPTGEVKIASLDIRLHCMPLPPGSPPVF